jgi:hypothetical protein
MFNKALTLTLAILLLGCSVQQGIANNHCTGDLGPLCRVLVGEPQLVPTPAPTPDNSRVVALELQVFQLTSLMADMSQRDADLSADIMDLQTDVDLLVTQIAELSTGKQVKKYVTPCGLQPNIYNEVILRMTDGSLLAFFEQGNQRFLSTLPSGNYQTTDAKACAFTVNVSGQVCDAVVGCQ